MSRTAVAAPPVEPFEDLFAVLDKMTFIELLAFVERVAGLTDRHVHDDSGCGDFV